MRKRIVSILNIIVLFFCVVNIMILTSCVFSDNITNNNNNTSESSIRSYTSNENITSTPANNSNASTGDISSSSNQNVNKYYTITFKNFDGSFLKSINVKYGNVPDYGTYTPKRSKDANYTYEFSGWDPELVAATEDATYTATFTSVVNKYNIIWENSDGTLLEKDDNVEYGTLPTYDGEVPTKQADAEYTYEFAGWDKEISTVTGNTTYTATYNSINNPYKITIENLSEEINISGITNGEEYEYDSIVKLSVTNTLPAYYTVKWERSDGIEYYGKEYEFNVPAQDVIVTTTLMTYTKEKDYIYFGMYPQTEVLDSELKLKLSSCIGQLPTASNSYDWIDYGYYYNEVQNAYMWYQDINYENNEYRAVYFTHNKPSNPHAISSNSYQTNYGYNIETVYYFKFEPIKWKILSLSNDKAFLVSDLILDCQMFYPSSSIFSFAHNGGNGYANNYELSDIRKWLNTEFYNISFNSNDKSHILTTEVINDALSTGKEGNKYACENTMDKVFLLSSSDVINQDYTTRMKKKTDYSKVQGVMQHSDYYNKDCSSWLLRSPNYVEAYYINYVNYNGYSTVDEYQHTITDYLDYGVVPAINITFGDNLVLDYSINYELNGGVNNSLNPINYTTESDDIDLYEPTKIGYEFLGWTCDESDELKKEITIVKGTKGDLTFTANWKIKEYSIIEINNSDSQKGSFVDVSGKYEYGQEITIDVTLNYYAVKARFKDQYGNLYNTTFKMPDKNIVLTLEYYYFDWIDANQYQLYFGTYPQTLVKDELLINVCGYVPKYN